MNTLVIYDNTGYIIFQGQGSLREPIGVPFMWVEVPQGKYVESINISSATHIPVFADLPKSETDFLKEQVAQTNKDMQDLMDYLAEIEIL